MSECKCKQEITDLLKAEGVDAIVLEVGVDKPPVQVVDFLVLTCPHDAMFHVEFTGKDSLGGFTGAAIANGMRHV